MTKGVRTELKQALRQIRGGRKNLYRATFLGEPNQEQSEDEMAIERIWRAICKNVKALERLAK